MSTRRSGYRQAQDLRCLVASAPALERQCWPVGPGVSARALAGETGEAVVYPSRYPRVYNLSSSDHAFGGQRPDITTTGAWQTYAAVLPLWRHQLDLRSRSLIQRYRPLMDQALLNAHHRLERLS